MITSRRSWLKSAALFVVGLVLPAIPARLRGHPKYLAMIDEGHKTCPFCDSAEHIPDPASLRAPSRHDLCDFCGGEAHIPCIDNYDLNVAVRHEGKFGPLFMGIDPGNPKGGWSSTLYAGKWPPSEEKTLPEVVAYG